MTISPADDSGTEHDYSAGDLTKSRASAPWTKSDPSQMAAVLSSWLQHNGTDKVSGFRLTFLLQIHIVYSANDSRSENLYYAAAVLVDRTAR